MEYFIPIKLSESQRPVFLEGEIEVILQDHVALYDGDKHTQYEKGAGYLTTHRFIWISTEGNPKTAVALYHHAVQSVDLQSAGMMSFGATPKISIQSNIRAGFKHGGRENFIAKYKSALQNKAWEKDTTPVQQEFSTRSAGVSGLMRNITKKTEDTNNTINQAFTDINALVAKAKELVALSDKFSAIQKAEGGGGGTTEEQEFRDFLVSMGITSPVTKQNAGSLYHTQLSRQLSDWLYTKVLPKSQTAMIQLTDMYCLFNRARGSELISTEDLYRACVLFDELNLPVRLRRFESGVLVVQAATQSDEAIAANIKKKIEEHGPLSALEISQKLEISPVLALEQMLSAEKLEYLCRDETFAGIVFYLNIFKDM